MDATFTAWRQVAALRVMAGEAEATAMRDES